nr:complement receptor type 1-like isoform X2 [Pogona vitticeps]
MRSGVRPSLPSLGVMWDFSPGGHWVPRLVGTLTLLALPQGPLVPDSVPENHEVKYRCKPGFINIPGRNETSICIGNSWLKMEELCAVATCEEPAVENGIKLSGFQHSYTSGDNMVFEFTPYLCGAPVMPIGTVEPLLSQYEVGYVISVYCNPGYCFPDETIEMIMKCKGYNLWEPPPQPCFIRTSHDTFHLHISNGQIKHGRKYIYEPGDNASIKCDPGYTINGPENIRYIGGGKWLPKLPVCVLNPFFTLLITVFVLIVLLLAAKMIYWKYQSL